MVKAILIFLEDYMPNSCISVRKASIHNLKNVDVDIPHASIVTVTGLSGSGKSSLALDTIASEGFRRYVQSLSVYARQFLDRKAKAPLESISGILPAISIVPGNSVTNTRSTVATTTELHDLFRLLFVRAGDIFCACGRKVEKSSSRAVVKQVAENFEGQSVLVLALFGKVGDFVSEESFSTAMDALRAGGFRRVMAGGSMFVVDRPDSDAGVFEKIKSACGGKDRFFIVVDRRKVDALKLSSLVSSVKLAYKAGKGIIAVCPAGLDGEMEFFCERLVCPDCGKTLCEPVPQDLSFNSPAGACANCKGFGSVFDIDLDRVIPDWGKSVNEGAIAAWKGKASARMLSRLKKASAEHGIDLDLPLDELEQEKLDIILHGCKGYPGVYGFFKMLEGKLYKMHVRVFLSRYRKYVDCPECAGTRLGAKASRIKLGGLAIYELCRMDIKNAGAFIAQLKLGTEKQRIARVVLRQVKNRIKALCDMGIGYLTLDRLTRTLSGGEAQRINLAAAVSGELVDTLFVLDEPTLGLHPSDRPKLIGLLAQLKEKSNTVIVIDHDRGVIENSDYVLEMGPGAGVNGGQVVFWGTPAQVLKDKKSVTGKYLRGQSRLKRPSGAESKKQGTLRIKGARQHNLDNIDVDIPLGRFVCVTGVSGAGKSSLAFDVLHQGICRVKGQPFDKVGDFDSIQGHEQLAGAVFVDQTPLSRSQRSNPGTYLKIFDDIRNIMGRLPQAKNFGFSPSSFSFNVAGGRCPECEGLGFLSVQMQFMADVVYTCPVCGGARYKKDILRVKYKNMNISDILNATVADLMLVFCDYPKLVAKLDVLSRAGLDYISLGQSSSTMSSGELQRLKLASNMMNKTRDTLFVFDEPSSGLHFDDITKLLGCFGELISAGNTVVAIEHNLDIIELCDYVIDLGPGCGVDGGKVVVAGSVEDVKNCPESLTGKALCRM